MQEQAKYLWTKDASGATRVGLTKAGQDELGNVTFAKLPEVGDKVDKGATLISLDDEKAVSDIESPISGEVSAVNPQLNDDVDALNSSNEADAWLVEIK